MEWKKIARWTRIDVVVGRLRSINSNMCTHHMDSIQSRLLFIWFDSIFSHIFFCWCCSLFTHSLSRHLANEFAICTHLHTERARQALWLTHTQRHRPQMKKSLFWNDHTMRTANGVRCTHKLETESKTSARTNVRWMWNELAAVCTHTPKSDFSLDIGHRGNQTHTHWNSIRIHIYTNCYIHVRKINPHTRVHSWLYQYRTSIHHTIRSFN